MRISIDSSTRWSLAAVVLLVLAVASGYEVDHHLRALEAEAFRLGPWSVLCFFAFFIAAASLLVPDTLLCIAAGVLFGLKEGTAVVLAGSLVASGAQYGLSRLLLRAPIQRALARRPSLAAIQRAVVRDELRLQVLLRLAPLNPATISYLLGAAGVRFSTFLAAWPALAPHLFVEVYLGYAGKHVARLAGSDRRAAHLHDLMIAGGLAVALILLLILSSRVKRALEEAVAHHDDSVTSDRPRG